jgi:hypothetical protein
MTKPVIGEPIPPRYKDGLSGSKEFRDIPKPDVSDIVLDSDKIVEEGYRYTGPNPTKPTMRRIGEHTYRGFTCYQEPQHMFYIVEEDGKEVPIGRFNRIATMEQAINQYIDKRKFLTIKKEFYDQGNN